MHPFVAFLILIAVVIEIWYWFFCFPKAWNDGSNREINDIRFTVETIGNSRQRPTDPKDKRGTYR